MLRLGNHKCCEYAYQQSLQICIPSLQHNATQLNCAKSANKLCELENNVHIAKHAKQCLLPHTHAQLLLQMLQKPRITIIRRVATKLFKLCRSTCKCAVHLRYLNLVLWTECLQSCQDILQIAKTSEQTKTCTLMLQRVQTKFAQSLHNTVSHVCTSN